ncbi:MAG: ABC transporter ATP-binding protein [Proteobacteria bacterium]|nr:ABC transporter ATP-binding protein [Burkholderiales bacterium]
MPSDFVEISGLHFGYGRRKILKGLDLRVPRGKVVSIMGGSGCGKTTLLRVIGGALRPSAGTLIVDGESVNELDRDGLYRLRRKMGMLFQLGALFTDLSVFDNVAFPMRERTDLPEPIVRDLVLMKLHAVGLRGASKLMPNELSGGMSRRVALARAVALDPQLIMYDEPFTGLDPISLGVISNLIRTLNDALGATSIVVTHDVRESMKILDYCYLMAEGQIVAQGTPAEMLGSELPYARQFFHGEIDGAVPFHYPGTDYGAELGLATRAR